MNEAIGSCYASWRGFAPHMGEGKNLGDWNYVVPSHRRGAGQDPRGCLTPGSADPCRYHVSS